jgi:hypothetical protein
MQVSGSEIRDPRSAIRDPRSEIARASDCTSTIIRRSPIDLPVVGEHYYPVQTSKVGLYVASFFVIAPLVAAIALLGFSEPFPAVVLVATLLVVVVFYASAFRVRYELDDHEIRFRQGVFSAWRIPLHSITRVLPAKGQAGISLRNTDCLLIEAGKQRRLVAAPDPDEFVKELSRRAKHLRRYGHELRGAPVNNYGIG